MRPRSPWLAVSATPAMVMATPTSCSGRTRVRKKTKLSSMTKMLIVTWSRPTLKPEV